MNNNEATELMELSDSQWVSLSQLVNDLVTSLDQPNPTTQRLIAAFAIEAVRPVRVSFSDGTGRRLTDSNNAKDNELLASIVAYQLMFSDEQQQVDEYDRQLYNDACVEFTIPAIHDWLELCQLYDVAESLFGDWMRTEYSAMIEHNMLVKENSDNAHDIPKLDLTEIHSVIVELKAANEKHKPLDHGRLWKYDDVAMYIGRSVQTVRRLADRKDFPSPIQVNDAEGRVMSPLFEPKNVVAWFAKHKLPKKR